MNGFLERLRRMPLLADGAMGTLLFARGIAVDQCLEALVLERPELIASIHAEYRAAGADVITTHTFGANRMRLARFGLENEVAHLNRKAVQLVQEVRASTERELAIAGNVGPVGRRVDWSDSNEQRNVTAAYLEQIGVLAETGVDLLLMETFSDVEELEVAVYAAKSLCDLPVVASMSYGEDGITLAGQSADEVVTRLVAAGADVVGTNCSVGPAQMVETLRQMQQRSADQMFSVMPNAGLPQVEEDGTLGHPTGAEEFATYLPAFLAMGARLIGGCCGTTPDHVKAMRAAMASSEGSSPPQRQSPVPDHATD